MVKTLALLSYWLCILMVLIEKIYAALLKIEQPS